jgi:hypothetical protein
MLCNHDYPTISFFIHGNFHFLITTHELQKILGRWGSSSHYFHGVFDGQGLLLFVTHVATLTTCFHFQLLSILFPQPFLEAIGGLKPNKYRTFTC